MSFSIASKYVCERRRVTWCDGFGGRGMERESSEGQSVERARSESRFSNERGRRDRCYKPGGEVRARRRGEDSLVETEVFPDARKPADAETTHSGPGKHGCPLQLCSFARQAACTPPMDRHTQSYEQSVLEMNGEGKLMYSTSNYTLTRRR